MILKRIGYYFIKSTEAEQQVDQDAVSGMQPCAALLFCLLHGKGQKTLCGLSLGVASCYLWLIDEKPLLALLLFVAGIAAVMGICYAYAAHAIRFRINLPDLE